MENTWHYGPNRKQHYITEIPIHPNKLVDLPNNDGKWKIDSFCLEQFKLRSVKCISVGLQWEC